MATINSHKIVPNIWFSAENGKIQALLDYYQSIFSENMQTGKVVSLGQTPSGYAELCEVYLFAQKYVFMCTEKPHQPLNDSISLMLYCKHQAEIDLFWDYFTKDGKESQCGWCIDKYGVRWQILPQNLAELMQKPNAFSVMMDQRKIIIAEYLN